MLSKQSASQKMFRSSLQLLINNNKSILQLQLHQKNNQMMTMRNFTICFMLRNSSNGNVNVAATAGCPYHQQVVEKKKEIKQWKQVPGPKPWPLIGNLIDIKNNAHNTSEYFLSLCDEYGDLVKLSALGTNMLIVANPHVLSDLFRKEDKRKPLESTRYYKEPRGLVLTPIELRLDEDWNSIRQLYNIAMRPEFQENVTLPQLTELNSDFLRRLVNNLQHVPQTDKYLFTNVIDTTSRYAFDAVLKVFLGVKMTDEIVKSLPFDIRDFVKYSVSVLDMAIMLDNKPPFYRLFKTKEFKEFEHCWDKSYEFARYYIKRFKSNPTEKERLLELLENRAKDQDQADAKVESVMINFLQAGIDITVRMFCNNLYRLAHHPEYQEKIYQETVEIFGEPTIEELTSENGLVVTKEHYKKLKLIKNFVEEVLRLHSFSYLTMGRQLSKETEVDGYMIPKNTIILAMQRWGTMKEEYVPRAKEFIPERHEKGSPLAPINNFVSIPFGVGARKCPGSRIASTELYMGIINAVRHFKLSHENPTVFPPTSFDQSLLYIDSKKNPLYFTPRDHVKEFVENNSKI